MKDWAKEDQPVYKLNMKGKYSMSDAELLCIIMGGGSCTDQSLGLARHLLLTADNSLSKIAKFSIGDLKTLGLTTQKATALIASFEIGKRRTESQILGMRKISCSKDAYEMFDTVMGNDPYESFWILLLNKANKVIGKYKVSEGGVSGTVVDPKKVFKIALDNHASSIILGHNHPSGNIQASDADQKITKKIKDAGYMLDIAVLDHIILGEDKYLSMVDESML